MNQNIFRTAAFIAAFVIIGVLAFLGYKFYQYTQATEELPPEGSVVVFSYGGVGRQYLYANESLNVRIDSSRDDGAVIFEEIQSPLNIEDKLVLGTAPGIPGMFFGLKNAEGDIELLMTGGTNKADLTGRKDGIAVFAAQEVRPSLSPQSVSAGEPAESEIEEHFVAEETAGPLEVGRSLTSYSDMFAVEVDTGKITGLGAGRSPRFTADGFITALAENGVVRIDPKTGERTLLIPRTDAALQGAISPDGSVVAVPAPDFMSLEFFSLADSSSPKNIGYLMFDKAGPYPTAFTDAGHFFIRMENGTAHLYRIPTDKLPVATPVAIVGVND